MIDFLCKHLTFTFCALINNIEFSLAPLFMLVWPTVKTTQCMIIRKTLLRPSPDNMQAVCKKLVHSD